MSSRGVRVTEAGLRPLLWGVVLSLAGGACGDEDPYRRCGPLDDQDEDGISAWDEGFGGIGNSARDSDGDGRPDHVDPDSDGDGVGDAEESGRGCARPPASCALEGAEGGRRDEVPDFLDWDSDGDGVSDAEEAALGLMRCGPRSLGAEGPLDLRVVARDRGCDLDLEGPPCGCDAPECEDSEVPFVALWVEGEERTVDLVESLEPRGLNLLLLIDATVSMQGDRWDRVRAAWLAPGGLVERLGERIPGLHVALATHTDLPLGSFGARDDALLALWRLALPLADRPSLEAAFSDVSPGNGGDEPEGWHLALDMLLSGEGGRWQLGGGERYVAPVFGDRCLSGRRGAACQRPGLPLLVLHVSDACPHGGLGCEDSGYDGVRPAPPTPAEVAASLRSRGAGYLGMVPWPQGCVAEPPDAPWSPCPEMRRFGEASEGPGVGAVAPVPGLPGGAEQEAWVGAWAERIEAWWRQGRWDVTVEADVLPAEASSWLEVEASPGCEEGPASCVTAFDGGAEDPVLGLGPRGLLGVRAGAELRWRLRVRARRAPGERVEGAWVRLRWRLGGLVASERWVLASLVARDGTPPPGSADRRR